MAKFLYLFPIFLCIAYVNGDSPDCTAMLHDTIGDITTTLSCSNLGKDERSFTDIIGNWSIKGPGLGADEPDGLRVRNMSKPDFLQRVIHLGFFGLYRKPKFGENPFALFPNVQSIQLWKAPSVDAEIPEVTLPADAFRQMPKLKKVVMGDLVISDSTVEALASLKDQLEEIYANYLKPEEPILTELANFTKLRTLGVQGMCTDRMFPTSIFEKSAPTLQLIIVRNCSLPKITKTLFSSMPNLDQLRWEESNITEIEPESFDANPKMHSMFLRDNKIRTVPDGLFAKLKKLTVVGFSGNELSWLSRSNFTHVEKFNTSFTLLV